MANFIGQAKAGGVSIMTLAAAGVLKPFTEAALTPVIGDGNLISGAVKTIGGMAINQYAGRGVVQDSLSIALVVDGIEDLMHGVFGMGSAPADAFGGAL